MSAYGHQMEREYSARSHSSGGSERESQYVMESGFYMTSFAATIFIAGLVTVGVLLITMLIALTVMLQSCESRSKGVVETQESGYDYNICKTFSLHAELNNLGAKHFPVICRVLATQYIKEGQYARDLNSTMWVIENYFGSLKPLVDGLDVVLMDIDDILPTNHQYAKLLLQRYDQYGCSSCVDDAKRLKQILILRMYTKLHVRGWPLILLSRRPERLRNATVEHLLSAGCKNWSSLIMRSNDELHMNSQEYFSGRRAALQKEGFRVTGTISSHYDALTGPYSGKLIFKLPNPIYYNSENPNENKDTPA
ncbi:hypothetical protein UlMin_025506 [Ulmus minor]